MLMSKTVTYAVSRLVMMLLLCFCAGEAAAQNITVVQNLTFGNIMPGIPKTVAKYDAGAAAEFYISGVAGNEVLIEFTLPRYMNSGGFNMQMVFAETDCSIDTSASPDQTSPLADDLDPWHAITYRLGSNGLTLWLGGMAIPQLVQKPGDYSAVVVLTVSYTGN